MSLRDSILSYDDRTKKPVEIPEWGSPNVFLAMLSGEEREQWDSWVRSNKGDPKAWRAKLIAMTLVDEHGVKVFSDDDIPVLNRKSAAVLQRLWDAAAELNGLTDKAAKDAEKNS